MEWWRKPIVVHRLRYARSIFDLMFDIDGKWFGTKIATIITSLASTDSCRKATSSQPTKQLGEQYQWQHQQQHIHRYERFFFWLLGIRLLLYKAIYKYILYYKCVCVLLCVFVSRTVDVRLLPLPIETRSSMFDVLFVMRKNVFLFRPLLLFLFGAYNGIMITW